MNSALPVSASAPTRVAWAFVAALVAAACTGDSGEADHTAAGEARMWAGGVARDPLPGERRFASLTQLTFEGENAEAYFSSDGQRLIFQRRHEGEFECDQIFTISATDGERKLVSTGLGRTTCGYFFPDDSRIVYSSTHHAGDACPPPPDMRQGYVWALHDYDIYAARPDGSDLRVISSSPGYDAEPTIAPDGSRIVFTSTRDGDLEIYSMNPDGSDVRRLTNEPGYDGGPFFSPDGTKIVYRARYPESEEELADYRRLLGDNLVRPGVLDIYVMDADGSNRVRLTNNGAANFAPFFHPSGEKVIFASNLHETDRSSRNFDLFMVNLDGTGLEQVTFSGEFEAFPMFSPDGRHLVFASNRHGSHEGNTNIFLAEWIDDLPE